MSERGAMIHLCGKNDESDFDHQKRTRRSTGAMAVWASSATKAQKQRTFEEDH